MPHITHKTEIEIKWNKRLLNRNLFEAASIISVDMIFSLWLRCSANTSSGQWRSWMNDCKASSFQSMSSDVMHPLLLTQINSATLLQPRFRKVMVGQHLSKPFDRNSSKLLWLKDLSVKMQTRPLTEYHKPSRRAVTWAKPNKQTRVQSMLATSFS